MGKDPRSTSGNRQCNPVAQFAGNEYVDRSDISCRQWSGTALNRCWSDGPVHLVGMRPGSRRMIARCGASSLVGALCQVPRRSRPGPCHRGQEALYCCRFLPLCRRGRAGAVSPAVHVRRPRLDYESHAVGLDRNEVGALLVAAGLGSPAEHALISLLALNGLRVSEAIGADIEALGLERGHRTLTVLRKGGDGAFGTTHG